MQNRIPFASHTQVQFHSQTPFLKTLSLFSVFKNIQHSSPDTEDGCNGLFAAFLNQDSIRCQCQSATWLYCDCVKRKRNKWQLLDSEWFIEFLSERNRSLRLAAKPRVRGGVGTVYRHEFGRNIFKNLPIGHGNKRAGEHGLSCPEATWKARW